MPPKKTTTAPKGLKKSTSSKALGPSADPKAQGTLSAFFTKTNTKPTVADTEAKPTPASLAQSSRSTPTQEQSTRTTVALTGVKPLQVAKDSSTIPDKKLKPQRRIIVDDEDDEEPIVQAERHPPRRIAIEKKTTLRRPALPLSLKAVSVRELHPSLQLDEQVRESGQETVSKQIQEPKQEPLQESLYEPKPEPVHPESLQEPIHEPKPEPLQEMVQEATVDVNPKTLASSHSVLDSLTHTTPQRPVRRQEQITPTVGSHLSHNNIESLGLSPEDSVFWARTPPWEALKRLERTKPGQDHGDEVASIVGRLYQTSSAGRALRSMDTEPKNRISLMLDALRGPNSTPDINSDEEDETDLGAPNSPLKDLLSRQKRPPLRLSEDDRPSAGSTQEIADNLPRRRGRRGRSTAGPWSTQDPTARVLSPTLAPREDVVRMIEQLKASVTTSASQMSASSAKRGYTDLNNDSSMVTPTKSRRTKQSESAGSSSRTPTRKSHSVAQPSPGEFDMMFTDFDDDEMAELTQLMTPTKPNSASKGSAGPNIFMTSCATSASSDTTMVDRNEHCQERQDFALTVLDLEDQMVGKGSKSVVDEDEFGDFDLEDDFAFDEEIKEVPSPPTVEQAKYKRYTVESVQETVYDSRWHGPCKLLTAKEDGSESVLNVYLSESWVETKVFTGDIIHLIQAYIYSNQDLAVDNTQGLIIVKPDCLVSTSILANSFYCIRKSILDGRVKKQNDASIPLLHGTILHELFQQSLRTNDFSTASMESRIETLLKENLNDLFLVNESVECARDRLRSHIPACQEWTRRFIRASPSPECSVIERNGRGAQESLLCVSKVLDIEENIWSPMFGLKGKIDATVEVLVRIPGQDEPPRTLTVPLEVKTGKSSNASSYRAQTMLYTLLMKDRYDVNVEWGLLYYMQSGEVLKVSALREEIQPILMKRNELVFFDEQKMSLPPVLKAERPCKTCFGLSTCAVAHKLLENGDVESSGMGVAFMAKTDHLLPVHAEFLLHWNRLLTLEQGDVNLFRSQIWAMLSSERQAAGNCLGNMILVEDYSGDTNGAGGDGDISTSGSFGRRRYRFQMASPPYSQTQPTLSQALYGSRSFMSSSVNVGDPIVVSSENQKYALAVGYVLELAMTEVVVGLDRPLFGPPMKLSGFDAELNQSFRALKVLAGTDNPVDSSIQNNYLSHLAKNGITFRIDKDEMATGLAKTRNNLFQLFRSDGDGGDSKRRELIVDLRAPEFYPRVEFCPEAGSELNEDQKSAVETVLTAKDYALILGMPGTGKTTTISQIIQTLIARGKSVLLTSYTHSAVDNVLLKLPESMDYVRLGTVSKVHRDIQSRIPDFSQPPLDTVAGIQTFYDRCKVVATTCLGISDPLFATKRFDYCIVDEASQITLPICLGPIRFADVFVLVGDHNQLPPLVKNVEAKENGYDISLFKLLSDQFPTAVASLTLQYRMNKHIMLLSNTLVYKHRLQCATEEVANKALNILDMAAFRRHSHQPCSGSSPRKHTSATSVESTLCKGHDPDIPCWLELTMDLSRAVVFVDTDNVPAKEIRSGNALQNPTEASLVQQLTEALISGGVEEDDIGIISVYRAQLKVLSRQLRNRPLLDIHTVDRYQGKDKSCILVSLVRSNEDQIVGELLKDWRRINVAFTRAKKKLVIFGSRQTLQGSPVFEQFLNLMEQQDWILKLRPQAEQQHPALVMSTFTSSSNSSSSPTSRRVSVKEQEGGTRASRRLSASTGKMLSVLDEEDVDGEDKENYALREPKVIRAGPTLALKKIPITRNILDSLP